MGFCIWFTVLYSGQKGLTLCILDMFDHTYSGLKKSKFMYKCLKNFCITLGYFFACGLLYLQWSGKGLNFYV